MSFLAYGRMWMGPALVSPETWERYFGTRGKRGRRSERERVEAARIAVAKLPGTVEKVTRAEAAAILGVKSVRTVQRLEDRGRLRPCPRFGREVTYFARDVRSLASALGKGR